MSYHVPEAPARDGYGCGSRCGCTECHCAQSFAETYVPEEYDGADRLAEPPPTEAQLRRAYDQQCRGVRVLETLSREARSPAETVLWLERKLAAVPRLVEGNRLIRQIMQLAQKGAPKPVVMDLLRRALEKYPELVEFPFPRGYAVGSVDSERAIVQCQLAKARWELKVFERTGRIPGRLIRPRP